MSSPNASTKGKPPPLPERRSFDYAPPMDALTLIHVDEDIRKEYWTNIRNMPEKANQESFKSRGKHRVGRKDLKNKVGNH